VGLRVGLDDTEKRKFLTVPGLKFQSLGRQAPYPVAIPDLSQCTITRLNLNFRDEGILIVTNSLNIIHCPVFMHHDVSETGHCFRPKVLFF
jgi:hypothetical protein